MTNKLPACPFCGHEPDLDDPDTLYPSGIVMRNDPEVGLITYHGMVDEEYGDQHCYVLNCLCGLELHADSRKECIKRWCTRVS